MPTKKSEKKISPVEQKEPYNLNALRLVLKETDLDDDILKTINETLLPLNEFSLLVDQYDLRGKLTALLTKRYLHEVRLASKNKHLQHYKEIIGRVEGYIFRNLTKRLYLSSSLLLFEALFYGLNKELSKIELREWEERLALRARNPELLTHSGRGRGLKKDDLRDMDSKEMPNRAFLKKLNQEIIKHPDEQPRQKDIARRLNLGTQDTGGDMLRRKMRDSKISLNWRSYVKRLKADSKRARN
jgi:hypothetical protein